MIIAMEIKISYILPVYNVEKYLSSCIDSIYSQNIHLNDFEVICINDCSQDNSLILLEKYQSKYPNLIIINHKVNMGLSAARNTGINAAKGRYLWFVDSDDKIGVDVTDEILNKVCAEDDDVLIFNYGVISNDDINIRTDNTLTTTTPQLGLHFAKEQYGEELVNYLGYVWRFVVKREYIINNKFYFPVGEYWEDTIYVPELLYKASKVASLNIIGYLYRRNPNSISSGMNPQKTYDYCFKVGQRLYELSKEISIVDLRVSKNLFKCSCDRYINSVGYYLFNSDSCLELYNFAKLCKKNRNDLKLILPLCTICTKAIIYTPYLSCSILYLLKPLYKLLRWFKHKI